MLTCLSCLLSGEVCFESAACVLFPGHPQVSSLSPDKYLLLMSFDLMWCGPYSGAQWRGERVKSLSLFLLASCKTQAELQPLGLEVPSAEATCALLNPFIGCSQKVRLTLQSSGRALTWEGWERHLGSGSCSYAHLYKVEQLHQEGLRPTQEHPIAWFGQSREVWKT